jgi:hypothetical protein
MAHWDALLAAMVRVGLCQAGSAVHSRHGSWLLPQPLDMQHTVLLQQLLVLLQTHVSDMMLEGQGQVEAAVAAATVQSAATAAAHARSVLQMLLLPTAQLVQRFTVLEKVPQETQPPSQLDILRCLRQRACDMEAQLCVQQQLHSAGGSIMQLLFGLPAEEAVQVYASCSTFAGSGASTGACTKSSMPVRAVLGSSLGVPGAALGCVYLSTHHLAFTDLLLDCSSSSGSEDTDAIAKRVAKAIKQAQAKVNKTAQPAATAKAPMALGAVSNPAAAGTTGGSSASGGLATKSWWKTSLLPSSGSSSNSGAVPAAVAQQTSPAPDTASTAAAAAAATLAADTTLLIPLAGVARLDKVYYKAQDALALTMLQDRSSRVFWGFESAAVRDKLHDAVRLAVMGSDTVLDRNLRCFEETVGECLAGA